jgi:hypothetical protein
MTKATSQPRPDQVVALTRGLALPLPPIADAHLSVVLETISAAWNELINEGQQALTTGNEAEINALLEAQLNHHCHTNLIWSQLVGSVARGKETVSYNGAQLETRPDLSIYLTGCYPNFPIVVECKLIDHPNGKGVDLYCNNGVARFVSGQYSWAKREAIMLGYVRDGSSVQSKLTPHLAKLSNAKPDPLATTASPNSRTQVHPVAQFTEHARNFTYLPEAGGTSPGKITLSHLWLRIEGIVTATT